MVKNIFDHQVAQELIGRIEKLDSQKKPSWGKMTADQMLAHCNVTYEMIYDTKHPKAAGFKKFILKLLVKNLVVNDKSYKRSSQTAPEFLIKGNRDFELEKKRLIEHIQKTEKLGESHFHNKESHSFGPLTSREWNNMFYKHLDHHLKQFDV